MSNKTCDCTEKSNKLTDLEVAELSIFVTQYVLDALIPRKYKNTEILLDHLLSVPDLAVKFADTIVKSRIDGNIAWGEVEEIFGAAATLLATLGRLAGVVSPWVAAVDSIQQMYFLLKDAIDSSSPLRRALDQLTEGKKVALNITGDDSDNVIDGGKLGDTLDGMGGNDTIRGGCGNDMIDGGDGNDTLYGEGCNDTISGGDGNDTLYGGAGKDILTGGVGKDMLTGGAGADKFIISITDILDGQDTITDFKHGVDKIELSGFSFNAQNFKDVTAGDQVRDSNDYILYNSTTGNLFYDPDGWDYANGGNNGAVAKLIAHFDNGPTLTYSDFTGLIDASEGTKPSLPGVSVYYDPSYNPLNNIVPSSYYYHYL